MERTILIVTGLPGSGKSEVSEYIKSKGIPMFKTGDVIREEVIKRGLELTPQNSEMIARKLREEEGMDVAARRVGKKIKTMNDSLICVEGPRDMYEVDYLSTLGRVILVVTQAPENTRFERMKARRGAGKFAPKSRDPRSFKEFKWRDEHELERGLQEVTTTDKYPRIIIQNTGTKEELRKKVDEILEKIK